MTTMLFKQLTKFQQYKRLIIASTAIRHSSIKSDNSDQPLCTKYAITNDPEEWKYVDRLLPPKTVPKPKSLAEYPSGWKPQQSDITNLPYYISRTKNYMIPVYMITTHRGTRRLTYVKHIEGDIWLLERDLIEFLQKDQIRPMRSQVNEIAKTICFHGDHVNAIKYFLLKKNL